MPGKWARSIFGFPVGQILQPTILHAHFVDEIEDMRNSFAAIRFASPGTSAICM